ncbi:hypothetical protein L2E82_34329 [Cichorium intybus]|uniref:Uncharacterized protein n=1 Tax=Cichorium intybus TaxID=13427 RepID=A0ACB9BLZ5_CICIN|nr:hypothetical protein L2E82_34329 [Cichorium intybus]
MVFLGNIVDIVYSNNKYGGLVSIPCILPCFAFARTSFHGYHYYQCTYGFFLFSIKIYMIQFLYTMILTYENQPSDSLDNKRIMNNPTFYR